MALWNQKNLLAPPTNTYKSKSKDLDLLKLRNALQDCIQHFKNEVFLTNETALLSRILYRMKMKFRSSKEFKSLEKVNHSLHIYLDANMCRDLKNIHDLIPSQYEIDTYLPTRNMMSYILVRIQGLVKLMERVYDMCQIAAQEINAKIIIGHFWKIYVVLFSLVSRIYILVKFNTKYLCELYGKLLPHSKKLENTGRDWLPKWYDLPNDLREWLGVQWVYEEEFIDLTLEPSIKILDFFDLVNNEDDDEIQICDEYVLIDEEDINIAKGFKKLKPAEEAFSRNRMRGFSINEDDVGEDIAEIIKLHRMGVKNADQDIGEELVEAKAKKDDGHKLETESKNSAQLFKKNISKKAKNKLKTKNNTSSDLNNSSVSRDSQLLIIPEPSANETPRHSGRVIEDRIKSNNTKTEHMTFEATQDMEHIKNIRKESVCISYKSEINLNEAEHNLNLSTNKGNEFSESNIINSKESANRSTKKKKIKRKNKLGENLVKSSKISPDSEKIPVNLEDTYRIISDATSVTGKISDSVDGLIKKVKKKKIENSKKLKKALKHVSLLNDNSAVDATDNGNSSLYLNNSNSKDSPILSKKRQIKTSIKSEEPNKKREINEGTDENATCKKIKLRNDGAISSKVSVTKSQNPNDVDFYITENSPKIIKRVRNKPKKKNGKKTTSNISEDPGINGINSVNITAIKENFMKNRSNKRNNKKTQDDVKSVQYNRENIVRLNLIKEMPKMKPKTSSKDNTKMKQIKVSCPNESEALGPKGFTKLISGLETPLKCALNLSGKIIFMESSSTFPTNSLHELFENKKGRRKDDGNKQHQQNEVSAKKKKFYKLNKVSANLNMLQRSNNELFRNENDKIGRSLNTIKHNAASNSRTKSNENNLDVSLEIPERREIKIEKIQMASTIRKRKARKEHQQLSKFFRDNEEKISVAKNKRRSYRRKVHYLNKRKFNNSDFHF